MQPGDMVETCADVHDLAEAIGYEPTVGIEEGLRRFVEWYRDTESKTDGISAPIVPDYK